MLFVFALSFAAISNADVIYSNLGPGDTVLGGPDVVGTASGAYVGAPSGQNGEQLFESGGRYSVSSFTVGVDAGFFPAGDLTSPVFDAYLYSNTQYSQVLDGGSTIITNVPNTEIAEIGQGLVAPDSPGLVTFNPLTPISLTAGTLYWVILTPNNPQTAVDWDSNSLEVDGSLTTPEPGTLGLLACALIGLTALGLRQRHRRILSLIVGFFLLSSFAVFGDTLNVYYDQTIFQNSMTSAGQNPLTSINLNASAWTQTVEYQGVTTTYTDTTAANGLTVTLQNSGDFLHPTAPVFANDSISSVVTAYNEETFSFSQPIYALGIDLTDVPPCSGNQDLPCPIVTAAFGPGLDALLPPSNGFFGVISESPISSLSFYFDGCEGEYSGCSLNYTLTDLQLSTSPAPAPEPSYWPILLTIPALAAFQRRRQPN